MDSLNIEAINSLKTVLTSLLSSVEEPDVQRQITVNPVHIHPIGLGGFLSVHPEPVGDVVGRRLEAIALITLQATDVTSLNTNVAAISTALIGESRANLLNQGILSLKLDTMGTLLKIQGAESGEMLQKELMFRVLYEFRKLPEESEGIIHHVPINLSVG